MAALPDPIPGQVICYRYLWRAEAEQGAVEGRKNRPCAVIVAIDTPKTGKRVVVAPITHTAPENYATAIKLTSAMQRRLGLDNDQCWIIASEVNIFHWPGPDVTPNPAGQYVYGELPAVVFDALKAKILSHGTKKPVRRTE